MSFEETRARLVADNEEFRQLDQQHRELDKMLKELMKRKYLTAEDQLQEVELKKKKLALKDRMLKIAIEYEQSHQV
jgi:uncharacterized protein YdcH (DUF465 family)